MDESLTDGSPWTKVNGRNPWTEIGTSTSEVTTSQFAREFCGNGNGNVELQRCKLALLQHCKLATLQLTLLQHYKLVTQQLALLQHCKLATLQLAPLLQHVSRQRYGACRGNVAAARVAVALL
jgi:hypothetical protein